MARLRSEENKPDEALAVLDDAIGRNREIWDLVQAKAHVLEQAARLPEAAAIVADYAAGHWWHYEAFMELGRLRLEEHENDAALESLRHAGLLDIHGAEPYKLIARVDLSQGKPEDAYDAELIAIHRAPDQPTQFAMLSAILEKLGRKADADAALARADGLRKMALETPGFRHGTGAARELKIRWRAYAMRATLPPA